MLEAFKQDQHALLNQGIVLLATANLDLSAVRAEVPGTKAEVGHTNAGTENEAFWFIPHTVFSNDTKIEAYTHYNPNSGESGIRIVKKGLSVTEKPGFIRTAIWKRRVLRTMEQISVGMRRKRT